MEATEAGGRSLGLAAASLGGISPDPDREEALAWTGVQDGDQYLGKSHQLVVGTPADLGLGGGGGQ